jgi:hypothetical protein
MPTALLTAGLISEGATVVFIRIHAELDRGDANFVSLRQLTVE